METCGHVGARGLERLFQNVGEFRRGGVSCRRAICPIDMACPAKRLRAVRFRATGKGDLWDLDDWNDFAEVVKNFAQTAFLVVALVALSKWISKRP